jgi:hypothetical protein
MAEHSDRVRLADAIAGLRQEIRVAAMRAHALAPKDQSTITEAEIELTIVGDDSVEAGAEVGWWVLKAKAQGSAKDVNTQKVRLKLDLGKIEVGSTESTK